MASDASEVGSGQVPATAARIYDYFLGGIHNFPADQEVARRAITLFPEVRVGAQANRAFLRRAVFFLVEAGVRQFLDIGSGIPTEGNVHEIAQEAAADSRVVYVDLDPVAVSESLEILGDNQLATAIRGDLRTPQEILKHPRLRQLLDFTQPTALLLGAVLHFIPDDDIALGIVTQLVASLPPGGYLVISHGAVESIPGAAAADTETVAFNELYARQTATPYRARTRAEVERLFIGLELLEPGVVWLPQWRPDPQQPDPLAQEPRRSCAWAGVARKPAG